MKTKNILSTLTLTLGLVWAGPLRAQTNQVNDQTKQLTDDTKQISAQTSPWTFDVSLYGVAAGMSGDITARGIPADLNVSFGQVLDNLKFGAMGTARVGYDRWSLSTDVIYMDLGVSKGTVSADMQQWLVQPMLGYRLCPYFEVTAGTRYNNLSATIQGTGPLGNFRSTSGTVEWWDPVIGGRVSVPLFKTLSFDVMGDVGGFNVGSELTWQALPMLNWRFSKWGSIQAGYRWLFSDYSQGSGTSQFRYDILTQGPQIGFTLSF
ncbi:MAG: hypothetical protein ACLQU3_07460 [Limisphaerales bacterium]